MERVTGYFVDTYSIIEFLKGNKKFIKYFKGNPIATILNLMELYYIVLRDFGKKQADKEFSRFLNCSVDFNNEDVKEAMQFRLKFRKKGKDFSYADAVGYTVAKKNKVKFVTGDDAFRKLRNVKFVK